MKHKTKLYFCLYFYGYLMKCAYCGSYIDIPFTCVHEGNQLCFCDILCGRLYDYNIHDIYPMMKRYNKLYVANQLNMSSKILYERLNSYGLFKMIPVCDSRESPIHTRKYYITTFGL